MCGLYKGDTSFRWGVGVRKVRIDRLLTRVTCAFLGTLDPGYTHGNRPHGPSTFSLSPLSSPPPLPSLFLGRSRPLFVPLFERMNEGVHLLLLGEFRQFSKSVQCPSILTLRALDLTLLTLSIRKYRWFGKYRCRSAKFKEIGSL